jgi:phosphopantothenoylcysteine decarboxylase/phosphopantothenate--cysteine ligase
VHCLVTAGPTYEALDNVRRLTNFSTGSLGSALAGFLNSLGHEVTLLIGEQATYAGDRHANHLETFTTTHDLQARLQSARSAPVDAIFHAAAVSDFTFGKVWSRAPDGEMTELKVGKLSTRQGTLLAELLPTPKIIARLREWHPSAVIVGWKYEVDGTRQDVIHLAQRQVTECRTNACIANGPAFGPGFGFVNAAGDCLELPTRKELFAKLASLLTPHP